jgi:hypothetical protein
LVTEQQRFEEVLRELGELLLALGDLSSRTVLIGGQVLALESRLRGGSGVIAVETDAGPVVDRGFSFEPDLLFDMDGGEFMDERLPQVLQARGYKRIHRQHRWSKELVGGPMHLDLFAPAHAEPAELPTPMTLVPDARVVLRGAHRVELTIGDTPLRIALPNAAGFLAMKVRAKQDQRPNETKDSFDIFAYVKLVGPVEVLASLAQAGAEGRMIRARLVDLFRDTSAPGVQDVVEYASSLEAQEQELLAQAAVDLFSDF